MAVGVVKQSVKKETVTQRVRQQLEQDVILGAYGPGAHLDETALSIRLGCSRTPVREALNQLVALGLLVRRNHCGVYVADHDSNRLRELAEAYVEVEALCAALAISRMSGDDRRAALGKSRDSKALLGAIRTGCGNPVISDLAEGLRARLETHLRQGEGQGWMTDAQTVSDLAAAVAEGNKDLASDIIRSRIRSAIDGVFQRIE